MVIHSSQFRAVLALVPNREASPASFLSLNGILPVGGSIASCWANSKLCRLLVQRGAQGLKPLSGFAVAASLDDFKLAGAVNRAQQRHPGGGIKLKPIAARHLLCVGACALRLWVLNRHGSLAFVCVG